jgi:hypothetical protein
MLKRLILFLIRLRLGLKKHEEFQFTNQKSDWDTYFFTNSQLLKVEKSKVRPSSVSLNWLLDDECKITVIQR